MIKNIFVVAFAVLFAFNAPAFALAQEAELNTQIQAEETTNTEKQTEESNDEGESKQTPEVVEEVTVVEESQMTICHFNNGNGFNVLTLPVSNAAHAGHDKDIFDITDQNSDGQITSVDCDMAAGETTPEDNGDNQEGNGNEETPVEDTDIILSCEDVVNTATLGAYLGEYDGDPECLNQSEVYFLPTQNIFPGEKEEDVVRIQIDGTWYYLSELSNIDDIQMISFQDGDRTRTFLRTAIHLNHNFPNWPDQENLPSKDVVVDIELIYHTSCDTILSSTAVLVEYLARFNPETSIVCETETLTLSIQDEITIEKGSDLLSQLTFTFDGVEYTSSDLSFSAILDDFTSENVGTFTVKVGAQKDGVSTAEDVIVTVISTETEDNGDTETGSTGGGSSSGVFTGGSSSAGGQVAGAFDDNTQGEVLGESTTACPAFSAFHRRGDKGGEVTSIQAFLNTHMSAGLAEDGMYGPLTEKAVHAFQQKYWDQIIKPWTPALSSRTTGRWYKTTNAWANVLSGCGVSPVFLEDTGKMYTPVTTENQA